MNGLKLSALTDLMVDDYHEFYQRLQFKTENRVLLLDEADMFFSDDFCGRQFSITNVMEHPSVANLLWTIWSNREAYSLGNVRSAVAKVVAGPEYAQCLTAFRNTELPAILREAATAMLIDRQLVASGKGVDAKAMKGMKIGHRVTDDGPFLGVRSRFVLQSPI